MTPRPDSPWPIPPAKTASQDRQRRQIQRILAAGRPERRRLRPLELLLLALIAAHLLVDNLGARQAGPPAAHSAAPCLCPPSAGFTPGPD